MTLTEINIREKKFHNELQSQKKGRFEKNFGSKSGGGGGFMG